MTNARYRELSYQLAAQFP